MGSRSGAHYLAQRLRHRRCFGVLVINAAAGVRQVIRASEAMNAEMFHCLAALIHGNGLVRLQLRLPGERKQPRLDLRRTELRNAEDADFIVEQCL